MEDNSAHNRYLKMQLEIAEQELSTIKSSRGYRLVRLAGYAKSQLKQSPVSFSAKVVKKLVNPKVGKIAQISSNISSIETLQSQYKKWMIFNEPDQTELEDQKRQSDQFKQKPLISIITPVFNPPVKVFEELIESVLAQTYPYFELCLGNCGTDLAIEKIIKKYVAKDSRVKTWAMPNKGIAANSNAILKKAKGDYIALLDHDDTLSPDALFENVKLINTASYDFIYSDKDKIDEENNRFEPFFKPDWSPEILLNANYLTHLNVMKTSLVNKVGGWSSDTDGAQDWDLFFKVTEASKMIGHIPKVLYHWRVISTSTAMSIETKPYALEGQRNAIDRHLQKNNIKAESYHVGAELLLKWPKQRAVLAVIVYSHSYASLHQFLERLSEAAKTTSSDKTKYFILQDYTSDINSANLPKNVEFIHYKRGNYALALSQLVNKLSEAKVIFLDDRIDPETFLKNKTEDLTGWLDIDSVMAVGPRVVHHNTDQALDCGAVITSEGIRPLFYGAVPYLQAPIGNIEWIRNLKLISSLVFASKTEAIQKVLKPVISKELPDEFTHSAIQLELSNKGRLIFNPKVYVGMAQNSKFSPERYYASASVILKNFLKLSDPYGNPNLEASNPMNVAPVVKQAIDDSEATSEISDTYIREAMAHALNISLNEDQFKSNTAYIESEHSKPLTDIQSVIFILPGFHAIYAGLNNIFSYAEFLRSSNIKVNFALILDQRQLPEHIKTIGDKFPELAREAKFFAVTNHNIDSLPETDIAICTQWATAYILAKYNKTKRKCYFIQDKEESFYPKGSISALVENTYKMKYFGLANTPGLLDWYKTNYGGDGVVIKSKVDLSTYSRSKTPNTKPTKPYKVFFYGRPGEPRNAFELGVAGLVKLKERYKNDVEIYTAGAEWNPAEFGLETVLTNMGKIAYDKLPLFYRSMDAGMMFMFSGHPGVVASELMSTGCPVVVNQYNDDTWNSLYVNNENSLVATPSAEAIADKIELILNDEHLREKVINNAAKTVKDFYKNYTESCELSLGKLKQPLL